MGILLSICVCTLPERSLFFMQLSERLLPQVEEFKDIVEVICDRRPKGFICEDGKPLTVGRKRNDLLKAAKGEYVAAFDDDDLPSPDYIKLIVQALETRPDGVGISGIQTVDGVFPGVLFVHSRVHDHWFELGGVRYRSENHLNPVRREHALKAGFTDKNSGEDFDYSMALRPYIKTEVVIREPIYWYRFLTRKLV